MRQRIQYSTAGKPRDWITATLRAMPHILEGIRVFIRTLEPPQRNRYPRIRRPARPP